MERCTSISLWIGRSQSAPWRRAGMFSVGYLLRWRPVTPAAVRFSGSRLF